VFLETDVLPENWDRSKILGVFEELKVPVYTGSCSEIYREKAFALVAGTADNFCPVSAQLGETSMMFLVHPTLTDEEIERTCSGIKEVDRRISASS